MPTDQELAKLAFIARKQTLRSLRVGLPRSKRLGIHCAHEVANNFRRDGLFEPCWM